MLTAPEEKEMATHSSVLVWRIPGTGEPGGLPSMGSHRVGHDWSDLAAAATEEQKVRTDKWVWWLEREARDEWAKNNSEVLLFDVSMDRWGNGDKLCTWLWLYTEQYVDYHIGK